MKNMLSMQRSKEIGSEFWFDYYPKDIASDSQETLVLSGRTALDIIIKDILKVRKIRNAYLPAYCCDSMIDPFIRNGIDVKLYDIDFDGGLKYLIDADAETDIFYVNNYFGYENTIGNKIIEHFKHKGAIIIYDKTHSLFMTNDATDALADYTFASIRKWIGVVCGAVVSKKDGAFEVELKDYPYLQCKIDAMQQKARFIKGENVDKQLFLSKYGEFGHHLSEEYHGYKMDDLSVRIWQQLNKVAIREKRCRNAAILHKASNVHFIDELSANSCPIFVPVFFESAEKRNAVKKSLINAQIYCPVHWPKNRLVTPDMRVNGIFDTELSLICDQRYTEYDMEEIIKVINKLN